MGRHHLDRARGHRRRAQPALRRDDGLGLRPQPRRSVRRLRRPADRRGSATTSGSGTADAAHLDATGRPQAPSRRRAGPRRRSTTRAARRWSSSAATPARARPRTGTWVDETWEWDGTRRGLDQGDAASGDAIPYYSSGIQLVVRRRPRQEVIAYYYSGVHVASRTRSRPSGRPITTPRRPTPTAAVQLRRTRLRPDRAIVLFGGYSGSTASSGSSRRHRERHGSTARPRSTARSSGSTRRSRSTARPAS